MRDEVPAWPPGASRSTTMVRSPSDAPYTAAARPAGPAPTITVSYSAQRGLGAQPEQLGHAAHPRLDHRLAVDDADHRAVVVGRQRAAPQLLGVGRVRGDPAERDLVAVEEPAELGAGRIPARADDDRPRRGLVGGDPLQAADPVARHLAELDAHLGRDGDHGVVVRGGDPHHPGRLGCPEAEREGRAERDRYLADQVAGLPAADDPLDPVDQRDRLQLALEHRVQRPLVAGVDHELAGVRPEVGRDPREPVALGLGQALEDRDCGDLVGRQHTRAPLTRCGRCLPRPKPTRTAACGSLAPP